jgi:Xaa-Pro aminopeptidase
MEVVMQTRIKRLQERLEQKICLIEDPIDLYYLTGLSFSTGQLWLSSREALLLVDGRYIQSAEKAPCPAALLSDDEAKKFCDRNAAKEAVFDGAKTPFARVEKLKQVHKEVHWSSFSSLTRDLRMIKDEKEIASLQKSADLLWEGFTYIRGLLREGVTEKEIALKFTVFCLEKGADSIGFDPIIAFGENSAMPHYRAGDRKLKQGDIVLIDIGVVCNHYHSDMTRTFFFGPKDPVLEKWHGCVIEAYEAAYAACKAALHMKELDIAARAVFKKYGVEEYFVHSLGHGVGLEIHESPRIRFDLPEAETPLEYGMVFTIEPGLYLPGKGGIRHENTLVFTKEGCKSLTPNIFIF